MNKIKKFTIILEENDGKLRLNRRNDGFSSFELLGILSHAQLEIVQPNEWRN